jgi:release factor glutamine methyltransferase
VLLHKGKDKQFLSFVRMKIAQNNVKAVEQYLKENLSSYYSAREIDLFTDILLEDLLAISKSQRLLNNDIRLSESQLLQIIYACKDLKNYKPIQYITEKAFFADLELEVNENVLIPRPETEELFSIIAQENTSATVLIDFCTGSGCLALALKSKFPQAKVYATDVSKGALQVAARNAIKNKLEIELIENDILLAQSHILPKNVDVIVSNPPYVLESDKQEMAANVLQYEPHLALFVPDEDALKFYKAIADVSFDILKVGGKLYFEIHEDKWEEVKQLLEDKGFRLVKIINDFYDKKRFASALR